MEFIQNQTIEQPALAERYAGLGELYDKRLYHQLTGALVAFLKEEEDAAPVARRLYEEFITHFEGKLNQLRLAEILALIAATFPGGAEDAIPFFTDVVERKREQLGAEGALYLEMQLALAHLSAGDTDFAKEKLREHRDALESLGTMETTVHSIFYRTALEYHKVVGPPSAFYRDALMFLAYTNVEEMDAEQRYVLATDMSLAALAGSDIYNFGEVLATPLLEVLEGSPNAWLRDLMHAFNAGDVDAFNAVVDANHEAYSAQPALAHAHEVIKQKAALLALVNMIFQRPAHDRHIAFADIAERTQLPLDQVEWILMRAMSVKLIKGTIDEVEQSVHVTFVQPRVLDTTRIQHLHDRVDEWAGKVRSTLTFLEDETPELIG